MSQSRTSNPLPPLAVVDGVRTPFAKAFTALAEVPANELGRVAVAAALSRCGLSPDEVGEVVFGNVAGPPETANIARVIALQAGIPQDRPAHTVNRNCASGMESVFSAWQIIREGRADVVVAGGTESMSNVPLLWNRRMQRWLLRFRKASAIERAKLLTRLRPRFFKPIAGLELGLTDPVCGLNMGETAEVLAREFSISRDEQDAFALQSHQRATAAWEGTHKHQQGSELVAVGQAASLPAEAGSFGHVGRLQSSGQERAGQECCFFKDEVTPISNESGTLDQDVGPRAKQSLEALANLKPFFDPRDGTITAGNSCPITDGAAALVLMPAERARALGREPLGYIRGYAVAGCDPRRMGLGPVFATHKLLASSGLSLEDFDLFEINEAFAAQVLACLQAMDSKTFAEQELGRTSAVGEIDPERLNVHGGAIALGHPVGVSGTRLILTLLRSLKETGRQRGLASLCVGGGQGAAVWVERTLE